MIPFEMVEPRSLKEALALLDPQEPTIRPVAGGTALMLMMKAGVFVPSRLICLHRIEPEYFRIAVTAAGELQIGAMASLRDLEQDSNVAARFPMLVHATAPAVESARAQCCPCRWRAGAWRSAHGFAAAADRARRSGHDPRPERDARIAARRALCGLLRDRPEPGRAYYRCDGAGPQWSKVRLHESHVALGGRLAGSRRCRRVRSEPGASCAIRRSWSAPQPKKSPA